MWEGIVCNNNLEVYYVYILWHYVYELLTFRFINQVLENSVKKPIHPKETFDMIIGTSTGGLISFALLAGKPGVEGKRDSMSVKEVIEFYQQ